MLIKTKDENANTNVTWHGGSSKYGGNTAVAARAFLIGTRGWNITDGGFDDAFVEGGTAGFTGIRAISRRLGT